MKLSTKDFKSRVLGRVSYDGYTFELTQLGIVKSIEAHHGNASWQVASSLTERNIDQIWRDIKAEARVVA